MTSYATSSISSTSSTSVLGSTSSAKSVLLYAFHFVVLQMLELLAMMGAGVIRNKRWGVKEKMSVRASKKVPATVYAPATAG